MFSFRTHRLSVTKTYLSVNQVVKGIPIGNTRLTLAQYLDAWLRHVHVVLARAPKDAMRKGLVHRSVCPLVEPPRIGRYEVNVPEIEGIQHIFTLARATPYSAAYHFIAYAGCHRGEALARRGDTPACGFMTCATSTRRGSSAPGCIPALSRKGWAMPPPPSPCRCTGTRRDGLQLKAARAFADLLTDATG